MKKTRPLLALLCISGSALAQNGPGSFYTNLGATAISDGSDSETAYFAQLGYNYYLSPMVSLDFSFGHTATLDSTVTSESDGFASKYNSYSAGLKLEQSFGGFNLYGSGGASYIDSEVTRWDAVNSVSKTTTDSSIQPYASTGITFALMGSPLVLDTGISYQWLPSGEGAASVYGGAYLNF